MRNQCKLTRSDLYTPQEISAILRNCKQLSTRALIELLLESGCRISEALNLKISDIQFQEQMLSVTLSGKTGTRTVPLLKERLPAFLFHISTVDYGKIFPQRYITLSKQITRMSKRLGLKKKGRLFHIFRHMKVTHMIEQNIPDAIIKQFMGWSQNSNMLSYYAHLNTKSLHDFFSRHYGITTEPLEPLYPEAELKKIKELFK